MRIEQIKIYTFDELDDKAKERARDWWRNSEARSGDLFWAEFVIEDACRIAEILGIEFETQTVRLMNGGKRDKPKIWWQGFGSQGDGASFEGNYSYAKNASKRIREYAPNDEQLHAIADALQEVQQRESYGLYARIKRHGYYYHEYCMDIAVRDQHDNYAGLETTEEIREQLREFARWIYRQLEAEYEYTMSDEYVDESIRINEYEFTADGKVY